MSFMAMSKMKKGNCSITNENFYFYSIAALFAGGPYLARVPSCRRTAHDPVYASYNRLCRFGLLSAVCSRPGCSREGKGRAHGVSESRCVRASENARDS